MDRDEKIKILEAIRNGTLKPESLITETTYFILPANDGSNDVSVITSYGSKVYSQQQFQMTKFYKPWKGQ